MSCDRHVTSIDGHAYGADLDPAAARHLEACASCRERLDAGRRAIRGLDDELQNLLAVDPSQGFARGVRARVEAGQGPSRFLPSRLLPWSVAGAMAASIAMAVAYFPQPSTPFPPVVPLPVERPIAGVTAARPPVDVAAPETPTPTSRMRRPPGLPRVEVIVPPERLDAVSRFLALSRTGAVDGASLIEARADISPPRDLQLRPLTIEELSVREVEMSAGPAPGGSGRQ
jgi:hypothetical protein